jgi:hypothetical protein
MAEKRAKKAAEEAKEAQANEQIRRKSAKVPNSLAPIGDAADSRIPQGHREVTGRAKGEREAEGYGKEEEMHTSVHILYDILNGTQKNSTMRRDGHVLKPRSRKKALREGTPLPGETTTTSAAILLKPTVPGKDLPEARLQICRARGGQPYVTTLSSDASEYIPRSSLCSEAHSACVTLREVAECLADQTLTVDVETVISAMNFWRFVDLFRAF